VVDDDDVHVSGASPGQSARSRNNQRIPLANASPARASTGGLGGVGGSAGGAAVAIAGTAQGESEGDMPAKMECVICLCGVKKPAVTRCGHLFCNSCIRDCIYPAPPSPWPSTPVRLRACLCVHTCVAVSHDKGLSRWCAWGVRQCRSG